MSENAISSDAHAEYIKTFERLLGNVAEIKSLLLNYEEKDKHVNVSELIGIYDDIFRDQALGQHIDYEIKFVPKSTYAYIPAELNDENAYYHLTLKIASPEFSWLNELYAGRIEELLQYFRFLFSTIDSVFVLRNKSKLAQFQTLTDEIAADIAAFVEKVLENDRNLTDFLKQQDIEIELLRTQPKETIIYKSDAEAFSVIIKKNGIYKLYHFTDSSNIDSIIKHGYLYSWKYCEDNGIMIPAPGGNLLSRDLDSRKKLENYVRASFCSKHPMLNRVIGDGVVKEPVFLEIDPEIIYWSGTKFSNMNATRKDAVIGDSIADFARINYALTQRKPQFGNRTHYDAFQAEVLVFEKIPVAYIKNL
ncbi:DarT ssDNA thymidine ADP-ribosyltransferase family protein [Mucilaginibacter rubeus]|uniref:DUF4433 domain-containing protein n=1 Tax=Mucilaginibacter rubeus TaxID=2027860 RepID=A0A5C1HTC8_9SPHI|nr:DarT ssDNA thymidine ADP-ribosyltransferase family protein [Mucilaginibacter rubeus]QEM09086.1 DUF4433 domain-containing protein [Mucilaginibacter rubeus]